MRPHRWSPVVLVGTVALSTVLVLLFGRTPAPEPSSGDPAAAYYTAKQGDAYGAVDRWAYYGMHGEQFAAMLRQRGFTCFVPDEPAAAQRTGDLGEIACNKELGWPVARSLIVNGSIDYRLRGRLVAATARSERPSGASIPGWLRSLAMLEPESLQVRGWHFESAEALARYAADALSEHGWQARCGEDPATPACTALARTRSGEGPPALPAAPMPVGEAGDIERRMESAHLLPRAARGADRLPPDSLLVRIEGGQMWLDFDGKDLSGAAHSVSIALESSGGRALRLVATRGIETKDVALNGSRRDESNSGPRYLVPLRGPAGRQAAVWIAVPRYAASGADSALAQFMPQAEPAFAALVLKGALDALNRAARPEETLGLYYPLTLVEQRADYLRQAQAPLWLPPGQGDALILKAYPAEPMVRAAWAMAMCDDGSGGAGPEGCWPAFARTDPEAWRYLRGAVGTVLGALPELGPDYPPHLRLRQLLSRIDAGPGQAP